MHVAPPLAIAAIAVAAYVAAGRIFLRLLNQEGRFPVAFLLGMILSAAWVALIGHVGLLHRMIVAAPLFVMPLFLIRKDERSALREAIDRTQVFLGQVDSIGRGAIGAMVIALGWCALGTLAPPIGMDALTYHLLLPDQYILNQSLVPESIDGYATYWQLYEYAIMPIVALDGSGVSVNLICWVVVCVMGVEMHHIASRFASSSRALIISAAAITSPVILNLVLLTKNDLLSAALAVSAGAFILGNRSGFAGGILLGAAFSVKPTAGFLALPLGLLGFVIAKSRGAFLVGAALLPAYWITRTWMLTGRPLPATHFGADHLFAPFKPQFLAGAEWFVSPVNDLHHLGFSFFRTFLDGMEGPIGAALLAACCASLFSWREHTVRRLNIVCLAGVLLWMLFGKHQARFLLPVILLWSAGGAIVFERTRRMGLVALLATLWFGALFSIRMIDNDYGFLDLYRGRVSREAYVTRALDSFALQEAGDRVLPRDARVLAVGEAELFPLHRRVEFNTYWQPSRALDLAEQLGDSKALEEALLAQGITHVLYNPAILTALERRGSHFTPRSREVFEEMLESITPLIRDNRFGCAIYSLETR